MHPIFRFLLLISLALFLLGPATTQAQIAPPVQAASADLGDAPDTSNNLGASMSAYPQVLARFPTVASGAGGGPAGPLHRNAPPIYYLGNGLSPEEEADQGPDSDLSTNLRPVLNSADHDSLDDGIKPPERMGHCVEHTLSVRVTSLRTAEAFLNVWVDWDRDGAWMSSNLPCPGAPSVAEWAVQNQLIKLAPERRDVELKIRTWRPERSASTWLRLSIGNVEAPSDGSAPAGGYRFGETEDYLLEPAGLSAVIVPPQVRPQGFTDLAPSAPANTVFLPLTRGGGGGGPGAPGLPEGTPPAQLREVDLAHIGGSPDGSTPAIAVAAAGSGAGVRLSSWLINNAPQTPTFLRDGPSFPGHDAKLHVLTPDSNPKGDHRLLVAAVIREGNLWLTTYRLDASGQFTQLSSKGYGSNAQVQVAAYTVAHREAPHDGPLAAFQVVTPIRTATNHLRMVSWSVNASTGAINGLHDSGSWGDNVHQAAQLAATKIDGKRPWLEDYFAVSYRSNANRLINSFWGLTNAGVPELRGLRTSGLDIRGDDTVEVGMRHVAIAPLSEMGFLSATHAGSGQMGLVSWDNQFNCAGDGGCNVVPHFIAAHIDDQNPGSSGVLIDQPTLTTNRALLVDALYDEKLLERNVGSTGPQGIASVTKVMTLILTLEAIKAGDASLDDLVTTSAAAAAVGGSQMSPPLIEGEVQELETLLYGLMVNSGNDAALAIAEHIGGTQTNFAAMMNTKAAQLGMTNTIYCQAAGGCFSTPTDQVRLWRSVYTDPMFQRFAGPVNYSGCGTGPAGEEICHVIDRGASSYPGQESGKGGSLGFFCPTAPSTDGVPLCASNGCHTTQATRLNRTLLQSVMQPSPLTADRGTDGRAIWDYGYRLLFTPDARGNAVSAGAAPDFGMDSVTDRLALTAVIDGQSVRLCTWNATTWNGQLNQVGCASRTVSGLAAGAYQPPPTEVELVLRSTLEADGDYLVGHRNGSELMLSMWRLGAHE